MTIKVCSWLKSRSDQSSRAYTTDEDDITGLDDRMDLERANTEEEMYKEKYWLLRKKIDEDEICKRLRSENTSLRNDVKVLEGKLVERENAKLRTEVQLMRCEKELNDVKAHSDTDRGANDTRNETLKPENDSLKKNEGYMKCLLLSHDIQTPTLLGTSRVTLPPTPELTDDDSDMDDADDLSV
ncbi:hypothetical protein G6011_03641 [Alternaria panax]|uniref:Uncharacterized protein n=1 Tax=Alternaria panax TaxID=48097 RepID=A0AAD4IFS5_9PLEO|nr:hypothetical protein G6011_03641 [Alternaria panax]